TRRCLTRQSSCAQSHWHTRRAPIAALPFKSSGNFVTTRATPAIFKIPFAELVPVALDQQPAAAGAPCAAAFAVVHVPGIDVMQAFRARDLTCAGKSPSGCVRCIEHFEIRMERGEMPRHIGPEIFREPLSRAMQLGVA